MSARDIADKWKRRIRASGDDIKKGVENVTESPSKRAIAKEDKFKTNLLESIEKGLWRKGLEAYSLEDWKKDMISKALTRITQGAEVGEDKVAQFYEKFLPELNNISERVRGMPDLTLEDRINRMVTQIREVSKLKGKFRS